MARNPRISVCVVAARPGGIDVLLTGLTRQVFTDFEMVLVDAFWDRRREELADRFSDARIRLVHTPPRLRNFPIDSVPQYRNTAIAQASGELLVWFVDYSYIPPDCLNEHWVVWATHGVCGGAAHRYRYPPAPAYSLPAYAPVRHQVPNATVGITYRQSPEAAAAYAVDVWAGFYDPFMYSIFETPVDHPDQVMALDEDPLFFQVDPKLSLASGQSMMADMFHAKNEGIPRSTALGINGFDESYRAHGLDDCDFGVRGKHAGVTWVVLHSSAIVEIVNPRHYFPSLRFQDQKHAHEDSRPYEMMFLSRRATGTMTRAANPYDLAEFGSGELRWCR